MSSKLGISCIKFSPLTLILLIPNFPTEWLLASQSSLAPIQALISPPLMRIGPGRLGLFWNAFELNSKTGDGYRVCNVNRLMKLIGVRRLM